jgi:hypothetical protein
MLDVGARDCRYAKEFLELGFTDVHAFDIKKLKGLDIGPKITYSDSSLFDYNPPRNFDIVVCRHVLPFTGNIRAGIQKLLTLGKVVVFTVFGPEHTANNPELISHEDVLAELSSYAIRYQSDAKYFASNYAGQEKFWHVLTFVVETK